MLCGLDLPNGLIMPRGMSNMPRGMSRGLLRTYLCGAELCGLADRGSLPDRLRAGRPCRDLWRG